MNKQVIWIVLASSCKYKTYLFIEKFNFDSKNEFKSDIFLIENVH